VFFKGPALRIDEIFFDSEYGFPRAGRYDAGPNRIARAERMTKVNDSPAGVAVRAGDLRRQGGAGAEDAADFEEAAAAYAG